MNLSKTVIKAFPTNNKVGAHLRLEDADNPTNIVVIDQDFMESYSDTKGVTAKIKAKIITKMQLEIDNYKKKAAIYDKPAYNTAITEISSALEL